LTDEQGIIGIIPDVVVIVGSEMIGVVELKYTPTGYVKYKKDLINFSKFCCLMNSDFEVFLESKSN
jgi:hypothetical protein